MALLRIPNTLRPLAGGAAEIGVAAEDLGAAIRAVAAEHPDLADRIIDESGCLYGFVNIFVGEAECRTLDGLETLLGPDSVVSVVPAVAGG